MTGAAQRQEGAYPTYPNFAYMRIAGLYFQTRQQVTIDVMTADMNGVPRVKEVARFFVPEEAPR